MELTIEAIKTGKEHIYMQESRPFVIRETGGLDYTCAVVLLRNLGEKKDTTSLEREALAVAIRLLQQNIATKKS